MASSDKQDRKSMTGTLPRSDISRFAKIDPEFVVQAFLVSTRQNVSLPQLQRRLSTLLRGETVANIISRLVSNGKVTQVDAKLRLTATTEKATHTLLGRDAGKSWEIIRLRRLPTLALGLDPDNAEVRKKVVRADVLKAAIIGVGFDLPKDCFLSSTGVRSELVWRVLRNNLPEVVGKGPFPLIDKSNIVDRTILAGLAGVHAKTVNDAIAALAAKTIEIKETGVDGLRRRLIHLALEEKRGEGDGFAERVKIIAKTLNTPPFQGRIAIAQIYDAYGRAYPDAGSLASFKRRLVAAAKARELNLSRLDLPEHMSHDLRTRSETSWDSDEVHFVVTEWI
jgi:hypothetical protein